MTSTHPPFNSRLAGAWRDAVWPVGTGAVVAVGLLGAWALAGPVALGLIVAFLWVLYSITVFGVASEGGMQPDTAVRIGLIGSVSTVALLGLVQLLPVAGWIAALAVVLTSPALVDRLSPYVRKATAKVVRRRSTTSRAHDQAAVDRAFTQIVADLDRDIA